MVLANCNKRMSVHFTVQGQDESDVIFSAFEQTLKTVVPRVGKMSEEQLTEHLLLLHNITIKYSSSTLIVSAVGLYTSSHFTIVPATELNLLVIFSVFRTPSLRSPSTTLLCGLAASDVIVGLIAQPLFIIRELIPNDTLFHMAFFFSCSGCGVSLLTMTLISLDRYAALHYHMRYATMVTSKRVICTLATMWFVIYVAFGIYFWKGVVYFLVAACFIISCLLLSTFSYVRIYRIVKQHQRQIQVQTQVFQGPNIGSNFNIIRLKRSTINTFIFYIFLILCYSPIFPLVIVDVLLRNQVWCDSLMYATTVIFMNSAINPILYCCVLKDLRKAFLRAARKVFCK
nr:melanocyte-stimulating hormone receptor-like [Pocillopora verrucosa]